MLKHIALVFLTAAVAASAATQRVPGSRVIMDTSGFNNINPSNASLQDIVSWIDSNWVHQVTGSGVTMITNNYDTVTGSNVQENIDSIDNLVTNIEARLSAAESTVALPYRVYSYQPTGTVISSSGSAGAYSITVSESDIGRLHAGMYVSNSPAIPGGTTITSVNFSAKSVGISAALVTALEGTTSFFNPDNTFTHVVPEGYSRCRVTVTGGGAGGGAESGKCGGGGGAGGTGFGFYNLTSGSSHNVVVGRGGPGKPAGMWGVGSNGTYSTFGAYITATGGQGGIEGEGEGDGGTALGAQIGANGGAGVSSESTAPDTEPGWGGSSYWGGGGYGDAPNAVSPGSGGCGGDDNWASVPAGAGADGIVVLEYY
jgi:hypothetical protein